MFKVHNTARLSETEPFNLLLYTHHGWGKTYQCRHFQARFGKGLILSGEAGLKSVGDVDIDYLPFTSYDGDSKTSLRGIMKRLSAEDEKSGKKNLIAMGYKWIAIDSLTELSDMIAREAKDGGGTTWEQYADIAERTIGTLRWFRNLPVHVYVTALAQEEKNDKDVINYWPHIQGKKTGKQVPALFDHVFCGVREAKEDGTVERFVITDEVDGWHGKVRDPLRNLKSRENAADVTELLIRMQKRSKK